MALFPMLAFVPWCVLTAEDASFEVTPRVVTVVRGGTAKIKLPDGVVPSGIAVTPATSTVATLDVTTASVTGKEVGEVEFSLTQSATGQTAKVDVRVIEIASIKVEGNEKQLVEGERRAISINAIDKNGVTIPDVPFDFSPDPATGVVRVDPGPQLVATAARVEKTPKTATITVKVNGVPVSLGGQPFTFAASVAEPIVRISLRDPSIAMQEGEQRDLRGNLILHGKNGSTYDAGERPIAVQTSEHLDVKDNRFIVAGTLPTISGMVPPQVATIRSAETGGADVAPVQLVVTINLKSTSLEVVPNLIPLARDGTSQTITASLFDRGGGAKRSFEVRWSVKPEYEPYIAIERLSNRTARLLWKQDPDPRAPLPRVIDLTATATLTDGTGSTPVTETAFIRILPSVANFAKLRVRLNIMDDRTVIDLFGEKTAKEFYVVRVRLNNNLKKSEDGEDLRGESILAFSDSIEVAIGLEKRKPQKQRWPRASQPTAPWLPVTRGEVEYMASTGAPSTTLPVYARSLSSTPALQEAELPKSSDAAPACKGVLTYRPYTFEMIVNSSDPRYERTRRARTFRVLSGIGTLASFVTSVAIPGPQSDIPLGIEKYSNLLIPGLQKLFPDIRATQRQNIVSMTMQPIEEIPFGSDLSRVLFFPKGAFQGLLRGNETRISEICPHLFTIEVAILDKSGKQTVTVDASQ
ncbi:MAG: hypothetical protein JWO97_2910 [Acidobacteria bacterium]|nr:hypothetical protein [Acidobacteriota bacterium]